jgi:hypothetical protein
MNKQQNHFINYLKQVESNDFHKKYNKVIDVLPDDIIDLSNLIIYGPNNIGKYCFALKILKKYSNTNLRYEKKVTIISQNIIYTYKISDVHIEIDFEFLGCNAKILWTNIYNQVYDIACINPNKKFIILCKNFNKIHSELLENFYSYMQENYFNNISINFILITNSLSFIPNNIINISKLICLKLPSKKNLQTYSNIYKSHVDDLTCKLFIPYKNTADKLLIYIKNYKNQTFNNLRELCYDLLVLQFDIQKSIKYILDDLIKSKLIKEDNINDVLIKTYVFIKYFNNNYRPIYHLENYFINLIKYIYDIK